MKFLSGVFLYGGEGRGKRGERGEIGAGWEGRDGTTKRRRSKGIDQ